MKFRFLAAALTAFLALPALAQAASGFATANVNMRSGPSTAYPAVVVIPVGARLEIHGCLASESWCDVSFAGGRGWVSGRYIQAIYNNNRVYVDRNYYRPLGIPTIVFDFDNYWERHYRQRDFYRYRDNWRRDPVRRPPPVWQDSRPRPDWNDNRPQRPRPDRPDWNDNPRPRPPGWADNPRPRPERPERPERPRPERPGLGFQRPDNGPPPRRPQEARPDRPRPEQVRPDRQRPNNNLRPCGFGETCPRDR